MTRSGRKKDKELARKQPEALILFLMLEIDDSSMQLARMIIKERGIPEEYHEDALQIPWRRHKVVTFSAVESIE